MRRLFFAFSIPLLFASSILIAQEAAEKEGSAKKPLLDSNDRKKLVRSLSEYFEEDSNTEKKNRLFLKVQEALQRLEDPRKSSVDSLLKYPQLLKEILWEAVEVKSKPPSISRGQIKGEFKGEKYKINYCVWIPKNYQRDQRYPLIVCIHDKKGKGEQYLKKVWDDPAIKDEYLVLATDLVEAGDWEEKEEGRASLSLLGKIKFFDSLKNTWLNVANVDFDRIFLDGYAEGGEAAWELATSFDVFAGVIVRSASPGDCLVANLVNCPVYAMYGAKDKDSLPEEMKKVKEILSGLGCSKAAFKEFADKENDPFAEESVNIKEWLKGLKRERYKKELFWETREIQLGKSNWINIENMETGEKVKADFKARVVKDEDQNKPDRIFLETHNVLKLRLFLNDDIVDLDKPVEVILNNSEKAAFLGKLDRSLLFLLDDCFEKRGYQSGIYVADLIVETP